MFNSLLSALMLVTSLHSFTIVQGEKDQIDSLVGTDQKAWVYQRFETYMSKKNRCRQGQSWTFYRDGRVEIKQCEATKVVIEEKHWSIQQKSTIDFALRVGDDEFLVLFVKPKASSHQEQMILRHKSETKIAATKDLVFYHEVD